MTKEQDARSIIARALAGEAHMDGAGGAVDPDYWMGPYADVVIDALTRAGKAIVDDPGWEWGARSARTGVVNRMSDEESAHRYAVDWGEAVRRRGTFPSGPWEPVGERRAELKRQRAEALTSMEEVQRLGLDEN